MGKDKRYKYLVQVIIGENKGQGVRVGSRCFWDEDTDDCAWYSYMDDNLFCMVAAFARSTVSKSVSAAPGTPSPAKCGARLSASAGFCVPGTYFSSISKR